MRLNSYIEVSSIIIINVANGHHFCSENYTTIVYIDIVRLTEIMVSSVLLVRAPDSGTLRRRSYLCV